MKPNDDIIIPLHMEEAMWYILIPTFVVLWMWIAIWFM
jgi:hypothetical protein